MLHLKNGLRFIGELEKQALLQCVFDLLRVSPARHFKTSNGFQMSVRCSNCGDVGWISDQTGYRYNPIDPLTGMPWPRMPDSFLSFANQAAGLAGFNGFYPDCCLINLYDEGAKMSLHQDSDEQDFQWPIVSLSLGASVDFLWGGLRRQDPIEKIKLHDGDVIGWGGADRLRFHGVGLIRAQSVQAASADLWDPPQISSTGLIEKPFDIALQDWQACFGNVQRINLTFRKAR